MKQIRLGIFAALAMALGWAERLIPVNMAVPGGKLGLANIITIIVYRLYGFKSALAVTIVRCALGSIIYGGIASLPYSLCGGTAALCAMHFAFKIKGISNTGVAIIGAFMHNLAQIAVACVIMKNINIINYIWILGLISIGAGAFTGICAALCLDRIEKDRETGKEEGNDNKVDIGISLSPKKRNS
ncbi:MAG: Gx transporter family protein [Bacillota bacterium]|nr:Gx transporter family protein [Bacillota bacterium]